MYAVKDDTETQLHIVLYIKVIFLGMGWVCKRPITPRSRDHWPAAHLANDLSWTREQNRGLGWVSTLHIEYLSQLNTLGRGVYAEGTH